MSNIEYHNDFGQRLDVGDIVGWGHRDGNQSVQQIGIVLKLIEKDFYGRTVTNARCKWVLGNTWKKNYVSTTGAGGLFVLDPKTLGQDQYDAIVAAAHEIAAQAEAAAQ